jgi:hypothetical protein
MAKKKSDRDASSVRRRGVKRGSQEPEIPLRTWTRPVMFPPDGPDQLKEAFRILNAWARRLEEWEIRVRAMCGIVEAANGLSRAQFERVLASVSEGYHSSADFRMALNKPGSGYRRVGPASDVLGHPPGEPFSEPIT